MLNLPKGCSTGLKKLKPCFHTSLIEWLALICILVTFLRPGIIKCLLVSYLWWLLSDHRLFIIVNLKLTALSFFFLHGSFVPKYANSSNQCNFSHDLLVLGICLISQIRMTAKKLCNKSKLFFSARLFLVTKQRIYGLVLVQFLKFCPHLFQGCGSGNF